jgi:IS30 family transposase
LTVIERKTRYVIIVKLARATKDVVYEAIVNALGSYKVHSITSDNGSEFARLADVGKEL